ncbi:MAG: alpha/beta hydrolase [Actinomycetota bacterium]|nr:alpha/beta hydrolase [Actinomycetota bacterium]
MESRRLSVNGVELAATEAGVGHANRLLLLHGFAGAKEDFTEWIDPLAAAGWHAFAYDQRGNGASAHPAGEAAFSLQILEQDLLDVVDQLGWDRFVLLGHSMGGMVAQLFALEFPERLAGLILMGTSHGPPTGLEAELVALGQEVVREGGTEALLQAQKDFGPGPLDTLAHRKLVARRPDYLEFCDRKTLAASPEMWTALAGEMLNQPDRLGALEKLAVPTLVVVGSFDEAFLRQSGELAGAIPDCDFSVIYGAGHCPQFETPDEWWAAVSSFLASLSPGTR